MRIEALGVQSNHQPPEEPRVLQEANEIGRRVWHGNRDALEKAQRIAWQAWNRARKALIYPDFTFVRQRKNKQRQEDLFDKLAASRMEGME